MTGRRNRAPKPHGSSPRAPLFHWLFYMDQKMGQQKFLSSANSRKIQCEHHLAAGLFVCGKFALAGTPGYRVVEGADPYKIHEIPVRGASKTLQCQRCGVAPPPTRLREVLLKFPAIRKPNNTFFLKVLCLLSFKKVGAQPFTKGWKVGARSFEKRPGACVLSSEIGFADFVAGGKLGAGA